MRISDWSSDVCSSDLAWKALVADPDRPLLNRAIGGEYAPGSTFKMTVALAGLDDGVVGPDHTVYCPGYYRLGDSIFHCWKRQGHGRLSDRKSTRLNSSH